MITRPLVLSLILLNCHSAELTVRPTKEYRGKDYIAFQSDSVRTYFSWHFVAGRLDSGDSVADYIAACDSQLSALGPYFRDGQLSGELLYSAYQSTSEFYKPTASTAPVKNIDPIFRELLETDLDSLNGPLVMIYSAIPQDTAGFTRVHVRVAIDRWESGELIYSIDIHDKRITAIRYEYMEI